MNFEFSKNSSNITSKFISYTNDVEDAGTLLHIHQSNTGSVYLASGKASQISRSNTYIKRGPVLSDRDAYTLEDTNDSSSSLNFLINFYSKEMQAPKFDLKEPYDIYVGLSIKFYLTNYCEMTVLTKDDSTSTVWPNSDQSDIEFFYYFMNKALLFVKGFPVSLLSVHMDEKGDDNLRVRRQNMLREQGSIQQLLMIINILVPISEWTDITVIDKVTINKTEEVLSLISMGQKILSACFELLYYLIQNNPINQIYVANFMPILLAHLGGQPFAAKCVTEMLNNNMELQETKIGKREISIFVDKLRKSQMNSMYLNLIQACCSCLGNGVDSNQCKVAEMIFEDMNDIVIQMHADYTKRFTVEWDLSNSLYISKKPLLGSPLLGDHLITKGLPELSLMWTTSTIQFSPIGLFGKMGVPIIEMYREIDSSFNASDDWLAVKNANKNKNSSGSVVGKANSSDQKQGVANYFLHQLYLFAEMCLDRNYVSMQKLSELFPYEALVTILKLSVKDSLKATAVNLLIYLHVDRDPQVLKKKITFII